MIQLGKLNLKQVVFVQVDGKAQGDRGNQFGIVTASVYMGILEIIMQTLKKQRMHRRVYNFRNI